MPLPRQLPGRPISAGDMNQARELTDQLAAVAVLPRQQGRPQDDERENTPEGRIIYRETARTEVEVETPILDESGTEVGTATYAQITVLDLAAPGVRPIRLSLEEPA